ncbi:ABC transporter substrate-binding protein [Herbidospora mongoliensis]|uniref:ABC transporter substrate-binding protein n=1 Tax=Herbidospora mongoliensis TaxID=688067 RepID=UPI00082FA9A5|nr:extracellular solute-binding protein [Herbidospora mongoliensis]
MVPRRTFALVAALALLGGCASEPPAVKNNTVVPTAAAPAEIGGELTMWYGVDANTEKARKDYETWYIDPYKKMYPKVTVDAVPNVASTLKQKVKTALAAGRGPDFIETPGSSDAVPYAQAGYLADLGPLADKEGWKDRILPWAYDMGVIDGKFQAVPLYYESLVLFYNKTLFEKNGWTPPTDRASLEKLADEMQAKGIIPFVNGNATYQGATDWLVSSFMNGYAGPTRIHDALTGKLPFTDQAFVDSIQLLTDYFKKGYFAGGPKEYFTLQDPQKYAMLAEGKGAMLISGSWEFGALDQYFKPAGQEWAEVALPPLAPGVPAEVYPLSVGGTISLNSRSKNLPAAAAYVSWMLNDVKSMWEATAAGQRLPLPISFTAADVPPGTDTKIVDHYQRINDASEKGAVGYTSWTSFGGKAEQYIVENIDKVVNGDMGAAAFCAGMDKAFKTDLAAGVIPPVYSTTATG